MVGMIGEQDKYGMVPHMQERYLLELVPQEHIHRVE